MIKKLKTALVAIVMMTSFGAPALVTASVYADNGVLNGLCQGTSTATGGTSGTGLSSDTTSCKSTNADATNQIAQVSRLVINILSIIVGVVAVVMIIVGGFRYITSGGDSGKVGSAKNTIIYAIIGLILVALAQVIVNVVLSKANQIQ